MYPTKGIRTSFKKPSTNTQQTQSSQQTAQNQLSSQSSKQHSQHQQHQQQQQQYQQPSNSNNSIQNKMGKRDIKRGTVQRSSDAGGKYSLYFLSIQKSIFTSPKKPKILNGKPSIQLM